MRIIQRLVLALFPLGLTPLWGYLIAESVLNFGGGEKDIVLLIPWIIWSLLHLGFSIYYWIRKRPPVSAFFRSAGFSTAALLAIWIVFYIFASGILGSA